MEFRQLGHSGLKVPVLSLGTGTFGGAGEFFKAWGDSGVKEATRMVDIALEHGINFLDTADVYSNGLSEEIVGETIKGRRDRFLISSKATFPMGEGPNELGSSRYHLTRALDASLKRLKTDVKLMPLALDQKVGAMVWSPLGWGRLTGKIRRGQPLPATSRLHKASEGGPQMSDEYLYQVVDALDAVAKEVGKTVPQVALNWLLTRPTVANVIVGARNEEQLQQNLGAIGWTLTPAQVAKLDEASKPTLAYPYWHQTGFAQRNPFPTNLGE